MKIVHYILLLLLLNGSTDKLFAQTIITVAKDGSGNFTTIQEAVNSLPVQAAAPRIIMIKKGIYKERVFIEKDFITLRGENQSTTQILYSEARDIFRCSNPDDWGVATLNLKGNDIELDNLSIINNYGFEAKGDTTITCKLDSVKKEKLVKKTGHQMALRSFATTRLIVKNCFISALGGDTVSPWNVDDGMFYFKDCTFEGGVDFYCPRGWALADNCHFICHNKEAAIWHDGSKHQSSKTVLMNCTFSGDDGYKLGRYHRDAQFYLINCRFSANMADADIYQKEANPPNVIQWGKRVYYYNCHKDRGDYAWFKNNLPPKLGINDINIPWVFDYKWKPVIEKETTDTESSSFLLNNRYDTVAENMLRYQRKNGGWPKHFKKEKVDYKKILSPADLIELKQGYEEGIDATIDNNATTKEIRYLAKAYKKSGDKRFLTAAENGVVYLLKAQYKNGGWPQFYPDFSNYRSEITYNDNAMINALSVLLDVIEGVNDLDVINEIYISYCNVAIQRGISCILKTQLKQGKQLTAWCAQYDAKTLKPADARTFELKSISGGESVGIVRFLMRLQNPGIEIKKAVTSAVTWFNKVKITGYAYEDIKADNVAGKDRVVIPKPGSTIWARFYDIKNNEPFFCGRDGVKKKTVAEIELERRIGYAWYIQAPEKLLTEDYPAWVAKWINK